MGLLHRPGLCPAAGVVLAARRSAGLIKPVAVRVGLGALQGFMGWFMVASGFFGERTDVSQYRLVLHLSLALVITPICLAFAQPAQGLGGRRDGQSLSVQAKLFAGLLAVTVVSGGFVAGTDAGQDLQYLPFDGWAPSPHRLRGSAALVAELVRNHRGDQFNHRLLAVTTAVAAGPCSSPSVAPDPRYPTGFAAVAAVALAQTALGIATLLMAVPIWLGALHPGRCFV